MDRGLSKAPPVADVLINWWKVFDDSVLSNLIECAQSGNRDLAEAQARVMAARAQRCGARAEFFPTVIGSASASRRRTSGELVPTFGGANGGGDGSPRINNLFTNALDASWEVGLFGKNRRAMEAATATLEASEEDLSDVLVSLLAEMALNYVDVRSFQARIALTETNLAAQTETYQLTRWRREAGLATQLDTDQALLSLEQTRAELPTLHTNLRQAEHRLAVLLGQPPGSLKALLREPKAIPVAPIEVAVGVPAEALRRRPDVRRAERQLAAQTAQIGVAEADRYPGLNLTGSIGLESVNIETLYSPNALAAQMAANLAWTLFDGGRIRSNIEVQTALQEQALSRYEAAVLAAQEEVENALVAFVNERNRQQSLARAEAAGQSAFDLALDQYSSGLIDFQVVLDAQRTLLSVQDQRVASEAQVTSNVINLYKALGGGWKSLSCCAIRAEPVGNP